MVPLVARSSCASAREGVDLEGCKANSECRQGHVKIILSEDIAISCLPQVNSRLAVGLSGVNRISPEFSSNDRDVKSVSERT